MSAATVRNQEMAFTQDQRTASMRTCVLVAMTMKPSMVWLRLLESLDHFFHPWHPF
jgi:hypothetical protein